MSSTRVSLGHMDSAEYRKLKKHAAERGEQFYSWAQEALWAKYKRQIHVRRYLPEKSKHG